LSVAEQARELLALAKRRTPGDRERLMLAIVDLCGRDGEMANSPPVQELLRSIFLNLVVEAEHDIRRRLAETLANAAWAPSALINVLALDDIEIARPVIAASPVLDDHDLIRLLIEATVEHQIEVASRPCIGGPVVEAILRQSEPAVLTALASNDSAQVTNAHMTELVEASRRIAALRSPLARHPRLTRDLAQRLYLWVGQSLRAAIVARFRIDPEMLDTAIADAVDQAQSHPFDAQGPPAALAGEPSETDLRLISKLLAAGQLKPAYLLRTLREGKLSLFKGALAALGDFSAEGITRATDAEKPDLLALACAGVGLDRSVFPTILELVRQLNDGKPGDGGESARRVADAFSGHPDGVAASAFRQSTAAPAVQAL